MIKAKANSKKELGHTFHSVPAVQSLRSVQVVQNQLGFKGALEQAKGYLRDLGIEREIVVTDGIRYRMYEGSNNFAHIAYANLDRLKISANTLFARMSRR